jgi:hypothetical protein
MHGLSSPLASALGFAPRKKPTRTVEKSLIAAAKNRATREARGTLGPKKKLKIKGTLPSGSGTPSGNEGGEGAAG